MSDVASDFASAPHASDTPDARAVVQRRLVGLAVLLLLAFVVSLLLRAGNRAPDALPSVTIPLNGNGGAVNTTLPAGEAPVLDAPEPEPARAETRSATPDAAPTAVTLSAEKQPAKPVKPAPEIKDSASKPLAAKPLSPAKPASVPKPVTPPAVTAKSAANPRWFVAVGAYKDAMAAQAIANRVKLAGFAAGTVPVTVGKERLHRVQAGPFANKGEAEAARATLIVEGLTKAVAVSEK